MQYLYIKHNIWDHFKISKVEFASHSNDEQMQMLKRFYTDLEPVCYGQGKNIFCCKDCVFVDDGKRQDCLKFKVNVLNCDCSEDEEFILGFQGAK